MVPADVTVRWTRIDGRGRRHIGNALRAAADAHRADLIAVGRVRHGWLHRALLGSVADDLARDGRHSLLVVPRPPSISAHRLDVLRR